MREISFQKALEEAVAEEMRRDPRVILLATDFTPTVTFGLVSGVHRYQYPAGTLLEYTDCIQIDTSINPGNSGGPLFNMKGELIGINGRISADKRGRLNSGVGYAISINQIKNFLGHLKAGLDVDHASLGAVVPGRQGAPRPHDHPSPAGPAAHHTFGMKPTYRCRGRGKPLWSFFCLLFASG